MNEEQVIVGERIAKEAPKRKNKKANHKHGNAMSAMNSNVDNSNEPNENANTSKYSDAEKKLVREKLPPAKMQEIARAKGYGDEPTEEQLFSIVDEFLAEEKAKLREQEAREFVHQPTELEKRKAHLKQLIDEAIKSGNLDALNKSLHSCDKTFGIGRSAFNKEAIAFINSNYSSKLIPINKRGGWLDVSFRESEASKTAKSSTTARTKSPSSTQRPRKSTKSSTTQSRAKSPQPTRPSKIVKFRADDLDPDDLKADVPAKTADFETPVSKTYTEDDYKAAIDKIKSVSANQFSKKSGMKKQRFLSTLISLYESKSTVEFNKIMSFLDKSNYSEFMKGAALAVQHLNKYEAPYEQRLNDFKTNFSDFRDLYLKNFKKGDELNREAKSELRDMIYRWFSSSEIKRGSEKGMALASYIDPILRHFGIKYYPDDNGNVKIDYYEDALEARRHAKGKVDSVSNNDFFTYDMHDVIKIIEKNLRVKLSDADKSNIESIMEKEARDLRYKSSLNHGYSDVNTVINKIERYVNKRKRIDGKLFKFSEASRFALKEILKKAIRSKNESAHGVKPEELYAMLSGCL